MISMRCISAALVTLIATAAPTAARADNLPKGYVVVPGSKSPDGKWQILIPGRTEEEAPPCQTRVVSVATGKLLKVLPGECFFEHENQKDFFPRWSKDSATLLWHSTNKWGSANVLIVELKDDQVVSIVDAREPAVKEVLAALRKAAPKQYKIAQQNSSGLGSWYRDGFSIDVAPKKGPELRWPLTFVIDATSDPKCDQTPAERAGGLMTATIDAAHKWTFTPLVLGHATCGKNGVECTFGDCD